MFVQLVGSSLGTTFKVSCPLANLCVNDEMFWSIFVTEAQSLTHI